MIRLTQPSIAVLLLLPLVLACVVAVPAAAQATNETANQTEPASPENVTAPTGAPGEVELVVDQNVALVDYRYVDGEMVLKFWSDEYKPVYIAPMPDANEATGRVEGRSHVVDADRVTTIRVAADNGVSITTGDLSPGFTWVQKPSDGLVSGPYSGKDVRDAGIGSASAVAFAVLFTAVKAKVSGGRRGERVA